MGASGNSIFAMIARHFRAEGGSLCGINDRLSTIITKRGREKWISGGALNVEIPLWCRFGSNAQRSSVFDKKWRLEMKCRRAGAECVVLGITAQPTHCPTYALLNTSGLFYFLPSANPYKGFTHFKNTSLISACDI
ncbi:MAG: hypothetical protein RL497_95 [Pseudomonadota bacterium]